MPSRPDTPGASMKRLFQPKSIAVVGASPARNNGLTGLENLVALGFQGEIAAVHPRYEEVLGHPCAPSIGELPFVPDAILVSVGRERVESVVEDAARAGVGGAVILATGFAEAGQEGREQQERITKLAREAGLAIVGPNGQGVIDFANRSALYLSPVAAYEPGAVALMAHSGSVAAALTNNTRGVRWSHVVSSGNEAVVDSADLLGYFVDQPNVKVIAAFLETIRDPERFFDQCDRARAAGKPVVVLKAGRTVAAQAAATAHTGALSAPDRLVDALFSRHGVIRVDTMEQLLETAIAMQVPTRPSGAGIATITSSGGQIQLVLDAVAGTGLTHPPFSDRTQQRLRELLPESLPIDNPLDYWGMEDVVGRYPELVKRVAEDENVDVVVMAGDFSYHPTGRAQSGSRQAQVARELASSADGLFVVLDTVDGAVPAAEVEQALPTGALLLSGLQAGLGAIKHLTDYAKEPRPVADRPALPDDLDTILEGFTAAQSGEPALELLNSLGIRTPRSELVRQADDAVAAATRIGPPVVMKCGDPAALHKTESSGVRVGLRSEEEVREAAESLSGMGDGSVLVQEQVIGGVELLLGIQTDSELGTFLLVGMGGIWTEILNDVAIRPVGLLEGEAEEMLRSLRSFRLLEGARGAAPCDLDAVVDAITRLDALAVAHGSLVESIDVNPLIATPTGAIAVDCLVVPRS